MENEIKKVDDFEMDDYINWEKEQSFMLLKVIVMWIIAF